MKKLMLSSSTSIKQRLTAGEKLLCSRDKLRMCTGWSNDNIMLESLKANGEQVLGQPYVEGMKTDKVKLLRSLFP